MPCPIALLLFLAATTTASPHDDTQILLHHVVRHQQGWGTLGIDQRAYDPAKGSSPLRIGAKTYAHGLGAHAPQETIVALGGQFAAFDCEVGVQIANGAPGSVIFQLFVDDKPAFDSGIMREATPAKTIHIDLHNAQELRLVASDAGDGINSDLADWADARLTPDPSAAKEAPRNALDVAPFAKVVATDPAKMEGTQAKRTEEFPAADVFPDEAIAPDAKGGYTPKAYDGGTSCIGLQWLERRRIERLALRFAGDAPAAENIRLEAWDGMSRWQGKWNAIASKGERKGDTLTWALDLGGTPQNTNGALQFRWIFGANASGRESPRSITPPRVAGFEAWSMSTTAETEIQFERTPGAPAGHGSIAPYNTALLTPRPPGTGWDFAAPLKLRIRYTTPRAWQASDRSLLRLELPEGLTTIAIDTLLEKGQLYVPDAHLYVTLATQSPQNGDTQRTQSEAARRNVDQQGNATTDVPASTVIPAKAGIQAEPAHASPTLGEYLKQIASEKTILDRVHAMPDQTLEQATAHNARKDANLGPTLLSLACDNRKFLVGRDGSVSWSDDPAVYDAFDHSVDPAATFNCKLLPHFDGANADLFNRRFDTDVPWPELEFTSKDAICSQAVFVVPSDRMISLKAFDIPPSSSGHPDWSSDRPLGVIVFNFSNRKGVSVGNVDFSLECLSNIGAKRYATVTRKGDWACFERDGRPLAWVPLNDALELDVTMTDHAVHFVGEVNINAGAQCIAYVPRWQQSNTAPEFAHDERLAYTEPVYWFKVLADAASIETPVDSLNHLIHASQEHCLMAARNDHGRTIAPWIASIHYGPLESEANSVIRGMMAMGHEDFARRSLLYFVERYNKEGFLTTGYTTMGTGWHLWTLGEFYSLYRDRDFMKKIAPEVVRVCTWVSEQRAKTRRNGADGLPVPESGLMPAGPLADWNLSAYYFYGNMYYAAGMEGVGAALEDIGWPGGEAIRKEGAEFRETILHALDYASRRAPVVPLRDGTCVPFYPCQLYTPGAIGDLYPGDDGNRSWCYDVELGSQHLIATGLLDPHNTTATAMMNHLEDTQFLHEGWFYYPAKESEADWFNRGGFAKVQPYYARTAEVYALRDDPKAFLRSYFNTIPTLLNPEDLSFWEHFMNGAYNKTHETGYFLYETSQMFAQARGKELWLAPFIPSAWLEDGKSMEVSKLPTPFGRVEYHLYSTLRDGHVYVDITPPDREVPAAIVVRLRTEHDNVIKKVETTPPGIPLEVDKNVIRFHPRDKEAFKAAVKFAL